jgi:pyruvate dehydrogenase E2 component (dihydrolipoamide acetyltransferase)
MATIVEMPRYGANMEEGTVAGWNVSEGDTVEKGQIICEIEIEKLTNELEAPAAGVVRKILCPEGESRACGEAIAVIAGTEEDISALTGEGDVQVSSEPPSPEKSEAETVDASPARPAGEAKITPKARKLAEEIGIDFQSVKGTGIHGMITRQDIRGWAESGAAKPSVRAQSRAGTSAGSSALATETAAAASGYRQVYAAGEGAKMSGIRKVTSRRMMESMMGSAQTSIFMDADISELVESYKRAKVLYEKEGARLSYSAIMLKAAAKALEAHPIIRTVMTGPETITTLEEINIGIAVDGDGGLTVPVLKKVNQLELKEVCRELTRLADRAKTGTLVADEMSGGSFTVSNVGMYGVKYFTPILNAPESAILGVGTLTQEPKIVDGGIQARWILALSLTYDHRIVDGAPAARFLGDLRRIIVEMQL